MLLHFQPLKNYPVSAFDGSCFVIPAAQIPREIAEALIFPEEKFDYYLAVGSIRTRPELFFFGTMNKENHSYSVNDEDAYYVPLSYVLSGSEAAAAKLPHYRIFNRSPFIKTYLYAYLQRKGEIAQRAERDLDPLRIPEYPDSLLAFRQETEDEALQVLCLEKLRKVGPDLYLGFYLDDGTKKAPYRDGQPLYAQKVHLKNPEKNEPEILLKILDDAPFLPKLDIRPAETEASTAWYRGFCPECKKEKYILLGEEKPGPVAFETLRQEVMAGLWGIPLYAFALEKRKLFLRSFLAPCRCTYCGSREVRRILRAESPVPKEKEAPSETEAAEYTPACSVCGEPMKRLDEDIKKMNWPCPKCKAPLIWQRAEEKPELKDRPYYPPEDFNRPSLKELLFMNFDLLGTEEDSRES